MPTPLPTTVTGALLRGPSSAHYAATLHDVVDDVAARVAAASQPFCGASRAELAALVDAVDLDAPGVGDGPALREVADLYASHAVWFHHPAYAAHLNCPVAVSAVGAEAMLAAVNTSVDTYDQSTVATLMERRLVAWTAARIGFGDGEGVFTSGGTQSNLQALYCARERALTAPDGTRLRGAERRERLARLRVLATGASHFSVAKSALLLGLDDEAVVEVATDADGRMDPDALADALVTTARAGDVVMAVVATAGTTDRGCVDPLAPVADACDAADAWLHVDAAYGGGLLVSPTRRHLLDGIERACSVTVDFHKTFFQPVSSSALIVRDPADLARTAWHADYLNPAADAEINQVDRSLQTTRRFDALKLWATLRAVGADGVGRMVDAVCDLAAAVHADLEGDRELRLVARTDLSTVLFRYEPDGVTPEQADALVPQVRRVLFDSGRALVAKTVLDGRPCLKLTLLNPDATLDDVRAVLDLVRDAAHGLLAGQALAADVAPPCRDVHPRLDRLVPAAAPARTAEGAR
ncbi:pyridoxal-dependent decarboxylase [Isoptericola variabilis]|uniref:Diaminobutyrate decarboxylase n=1 Tax=Isoptericola variabilis (strain 225) TaxID=743718 RepID=F6FVD6_ISOV2|nr:pyridoxal-dependent decarboxylase [Isoptericola variabilis]AEG43409.1 Diaminobutyrate decarboxylase [Isoptericola variabilis 225]TWH34534.1 L-2,4-diaminobutyrate decarboxylase [Isoptericola variabilis J7]